MDETQKALAARAKKSLILAAWIGIGICAVYSALSTRLPLNGATPLFGALMMAPVAVTLVVALLFLRRGRGITTIGFLIVAVLALMFFAYPHVLLAVTDPDASPAPILKSVQVLFGPIIIAFVALTLRPALAISIAVAIVALHGINILIVVSDPRTIITDDTLEGLLGPALYILI